MAWRGSPARLTKLEYAERFAAALALLLLRQRDAVGIVRFDDQVRSAIPPRANRGQWRRIVAALAEFGIAARTRTDEGKDYTGVWVDDRKIASIGVHARDWVTWHGFALNVTTDLAAFDLIVPCGIAGVEMTSVEREGGPASLPEAERAIAAAFGAVFGLEQA